MPETPIKLSIPFGSDFVHLTFNQDAELDLRLLLRFASARATHGRAGFWLEYGWGDGDSQMVWIDPAAMPLATFRRTTTPAANQGRENDMSRRVAQTHHLYFTAEGWQENTEEFTREG